MSTSFADLGVPPSIVATLASTGIFDPFPIQIATIPDAIKGRDLCGKAHTGSGKTLAFGIPMVCRVKRSSPKRPKGLVLAPTRELALQVAGELKAISGDLRVHAIYGGAGIEPQIKALRSGVDIVVACPGRLLDIIDRKACDLRDVSLVVVDEADRMADMGFLPDVRRLLDMTSTERQTLLFSATLDGAVQTLVEAYQHDPVVHELPEEPQGEITHHFWKVERPERVQVTAEIVERVGPTVVFSRTRHGADRIARQLQAAGVSAAAIHGNRSQGQRERALNDFHDRRVKALVATDVAARGIHVEGVTCVVHFDLPADHKDYVHRSGRTGRAGADGTVVALLGASQRKDAQKLARQAGVEVEVADPDVATLPPGYGAFAHRADKQGRPSGRGSRDRSPAAPKRTKVDPNRSARPERQPRGHDGRRFERRNEPGVGSEARSEDRDKRASDGRSQRGANPSRTEPNRSPKASAKRSTTSPKRGAGVAKHSGESRPQRSGSAPLERSSSRSGAPRDKGTKGSQGGVDGRGERRNRPRSEPVGPAGRSGGGDQLDVVLDGSRKVRASGASRRKAKREALLAAGVDPTELHKIKRRR
ncbi:MAG: DEAD/DEAH box helicase [Microthrixaceae bacterium]|jgi:superfamily II DNA/RNA helicase|nr:DEAD/DEAH box helicase [Microthrixaceae bacterium]